MRPEAGPSGEAAVRGGGGGLWEAQNAPAQSIRAARSLLTKVPAAGGLAAAPPLPLPSSSMPSASRDSWPSRMGDESSLDITTTSSYMGESSHQPRASDRPVALAIASPTMAAATCSTDAAGDPA
eukprot:CAMPEP_0170323320 /NCGR_PEP_ID=MMETSP0116_2-20130129/62457_1 /TAXON_ID=400756 /ORGANISM="Durinskia baltica, Strain CSIRO CS-38" /LENGTH=124 /DNA_ID=CAMNT_0010576217 /DNA_START=10 /DNA_END=380 /DNA_ORIENTATION=+